MNNRFTALARLIAPWQAALHAGDLTLARQALLDLATGDHSDRGRFRFGTPLGEFGDVDTLISGVFAPLWHAMPDAERRDYITLAGEDQDGVHWIGCAGQYMGTFLRPWLDIPPSGHIAQMRFHEFYRIEDQRIVEIQAIWDIPELMMQANAWPLTPALGREWPVPAPATQDGMYPQGSDEDARRTRQHIIDMLLAMKRHPQQAPEHMQMEHYWHAKMNWYGPSGIGTARGIAGFRHWHQIPFLRAMPDRGQYPDQVKHHFFAQSQYAAVTGWPNMRQTLKHDGWLGLPATGQTITLRSLDFWRLEEGKIRENWVLVDLLNMYQQIGIDVFGRMREFNKARSPAIYNRGIDYTPLPLK